MQDRRQRVGIYAGMGCAEAGPSLTAVAEMLQAPVATSVSGKGCIPDGHPLAVGWGYGKQGTRAAEAAFKDVDLVLAIGVRFSEVSTANYAIPRHNTLIHVDINPQNLGKNVPTHVCLCSDSRVFLDRLLATPRQSGALRVRNSGRPFSGTARSTAARPRRCAFPSASIRCTSSASCERHSVRKS